MLGGIDIPRHVLWQNLIGHPRHADRGMYAQPPRIPPPHLAARRGHSPGVGSWPADGAGHRQPGQVQGRQGADDRNQHRGPRQAKRARQDQCQRGGHCKQDQRRDPGAPRTRAPRPARPPASSPKVHHRRDTPLRLRPASSPRFGCVDDSSATRRIGRDPYPR